MKYLKLFESDHYKKSNQTEWNNSLNKCVEFTPYEVLKLQKFFNNYATLEYIQYYTKIKKYPKESLNPRMKVNYIDGNYISNKVNIKFCAWGIYKSEADKN